MCRMEERAIYEPVYAYVRTVPFGNVVTYGQVADAVGLTARQVGAAMREAPEDVPRQRVVGAGGHLPIGKMGPEPKMRQRHLLETEGVRFLTHSPDRVDMAKSQWMFQGDGQG